MIELREYQKNALEKVEKFIDEFSEKQNKKFYFSMATGSGKTIIMIELIKKLFEKMNDGKLEKKYILILFPNEILEEQFKKKCEEDGLENKISSLKNGINNDDKNLFYTYRIDLLKKDIKEKKENNQIHYEQFSKRDFYLIVDEAHKGQSGNAYRDAINFLSENGLQFLFSATFDRNEILKSEYYEYSLEDHIENGYGKEIFIMEKSNENEMEKNLLRTIIIFYFLKKQKEKLNDFHNPLIAFFVSSINDIKTKNENQKKIESRLKEVLNCIFFISENGKKYFDECKNELKNFDIKSEFQNEKISFNDDELEKLEYKNVIKSFFNSDGNVSVGGIKYDILDNKKEYGLYVKNYSDSKDDESYSPFCLIKIGSINNVDEFFKECKITKVEFDQKDHFKKISEKNINIIIGAYSFYTGWDTDRINILNYHGIGGSNIFGLQSLGRAMRVNTKKNEGKRIWNDDTKLLESVFIFESQKDHIKNLLNKKNIIRYSHNDLETKIKLKMPEIISEIKNENIFPLYIPIFSKEKNDEQNKKKYFLSKNKIEEIKNYIINCDKKILFYKLFIRCNGISQKEILKCMENLDEYVEQNSKIYDEKKSLQILKNIIEYRNSEKYKFDKIKKLEKNDINHFKNISIKLIKEIDKKKSKFEDQNNNVKNLFENQEIEKHYYAPFYAVKKTKQEEEKSQLTFFEDYKISTNNLIRENNSEHKFINHLKDNLNFLNEKFEWYFSRIDEDKEIFIPYQNQNKESKFYPDFIFWFKEKNSNRYIILYVDPKSIEYKTNVELKKAGFDFILKNKKLKKDHYEIFFHLGFWNEEKTEKGEDGYFVDMKKFLKKLLAE